MPLRLDHQNPAVRAGYYQFLGKPLGEETHHLLHSHYAARTPRGWWVVGFFTAAGTAVGKRRWVRIGYEVAPPPAAPRSRRLHFHC
ncbi:MAG TPA: iron hydrogenase small subunit [Polyangia bacterium]|nr:iron hydrogenase small subunit [Polyangia bacterium]